MNDMNPTLPPGLDSALNDFYTAPQPDPDFTDRLEAKLLAQFPASPGRARRIGNSPNDKWSTFMQTLRTRPALAILVAILALALLTGAAYAIGRLSGFIPGFGFTSDTGAALTLLEPVEITHEGITLRILQATSDPQRFSVTVEQIGQVETDSSFVHPFVTITLPNGEQVEFQESTGSASGNLDNIITFHFKPLPPDTREISLRYKIIEWGNDNVLWLVELPLRLRPLRADEVIPPPAQGAWQPISSESRGGLRLVLENIATASDKTILQVALRFDHPGMSLNSDWNALLKDSQGRIYPMQLIERDSRNQVKTYETMPFQGNEQLILSLTVFPDPRNLPLSQDFWENAPAFTFNPGPSPQVGQTWQLDETLQAGDFTLKITQATLIAPGTLVISTQSEPPITAIMFYSDTSSDAEGNAPMRASVITSTLRFDPLPVEPFEIRLMRIYYEAPGEWNIAWQAPAAPSDVQASGTASAPLGTQREAPSPTPSVFVPPTPAFSDPIWLELVRLTEAFDAPFQNGPGWIHYVTESEINRRPGQTDFPPPYITNEQWLEIDEQGYVVRSVYTDRDADGNILQQSLSIRDYSINLTTGEAGYFSGQRYKFSSSFLRQDFNSAHEYGATVHIEKVACANGEPCYLITFLDSFSTPFQNPGEPLAFSGAARQVWVLKNSGKTLKTLSIWRFEDGTERINHSQTLLTLEKLPTPPRDVLDLLSKVILP